MGPMCKTETEHQPCSRRSVTAFPGCAISLPMAAMRAANCAMPSRVMVTGPSRSSSDPTRPKDLRCCRADGSLNAHSPGSAGAGASPRTGRKLSKAPAPGLSSPASDSSHAGSQDIAIQRKLLRRALTSPTMPALEEGTTFFELGMKYASGRSGPADLVTAHKWFDVAVARGCRTAANLRSELAREMSAEEIAAAQREARLFLTRH